MPNIVNLSSALTLTGLSIGTPVRLGKTPLLGGDGREGVLSQDAAIGGAGTVLIQGHPSQSATAPGSGDAGWYTIATLTSASRLVQELADLPSWIRPNVTVIGTGTVTLTLAGVQ